MMRAGSSQGTRTMGVTSVLEIARSMFRVVSKSASPCCMSIVSASQAWRDINSAAATLPSVNQPLSKVGSLASMRSLSRLGFMRCLSSC